MVAVSKNNNIAWRHLWTAINIVLHYLEEFLFPNVERFSMVKIPFKLITSSNWNFDKSVKAENLMLKNLPTFYWQSSINNMHRELRLWKLRTKSGLKWFHYCGIWYLTSLLLQPLGVYGWAYFEINQLIYFT